MTLFPSGLIHYQQNLGCKPVQYISAFNSEDQGKYTVSTSIFSFPNEALTVTFNQNTNEIREIRDGLPNGIGNGREECLRRCSYMK